MSEKEELIAVIKAEVGDLKSKMSEAQRSIKGVGGAAKETSASTSGMGGSLKSLGGSMLALTGLSLGMAGALKFTKDSIMSTQATGDAFTATMKGMSESVTSLMQSLASGDFDGFASRIKNAYQAGVDYAGALDEISDRMRAVKTRTAEYQAEMRELYTQLYEKETRSVDEREKALDRYKELNKMLLDATQENNQLLLEAERKRLMGTKGVTEEQANLMIDYVRNYDKLTDNELKRVQQIIKSEKELGEFREKVALPAIGNFAQGAIEYLLNYEKFNKTIGNNINSDIARQIQKEKEMLTEKELAYYAISKAINNFSDEERDNVSKALIAIADAETQYQALNQKAARHANRLVAERRGALDEEQEAWKKTLEVVDSVNKSLEKSLESIMEKRNKALSFKQTVFFDIEEGDIFDPIEQEAIRHGAWMLDWAESLQHSLHGFLVDGMVDSLEMLGESLGAVMSGKDIDIGEGLLIQMAEWAKKLGAILIAAGTAVFSFQTQLPINPLAVVGFGAALIAAGAAVKAAISSRPTAGGGGGGGASGGGGGGGDIFGTRSLGDFALSVTGRLETTGAQLAWVLDEETFRKSS